MMIVIATTQVLYLLAGATALYMMTDSKFQADNPTNDKTFFKDGIDANNNDNINNKLSIY